jgi:hypothetical protein
MESSMKQNINDVINRVLAGKMGIPDLAPNPYEYKRIPIPGRLEKLGCMGYCERAGSLGEYDYRLWAEHKGKRYCFHSDSLDDAFDMLRDAIRESAHGGT